MVMSNEFDVVVVGGGPVGLWFACELALAKVNVAVLERRAEPVTHSRALAIQGRTLEVFALRGLADRFSPAGARSRQAVSARSIRRSIMRHSTTSTGAQKGITRCMHRDQRPEVVR
jgi:2-polyprenyl-6-methoxyphenol hydroxylase-like FAD-dependent oxidoreductase